MTDEDPKRKFQTVYFDGDCPMCRAFVAKAAPEHPDTAFQDFRANPAPEALRPEQLERGIHLVDAQGRIMRGSQAALKLLEQSPRWGLAARILQLPPLNALAALCYSFIARNRLLLFGPYLRLFLIKLVLVGAFLVPAIITRRLWLSEHARFYALTPVHPALPAIPFPLDWIIFGAMLLLLAVIFVTPRARIPILSFTALTAVYSLWDQSRWMPYTYQFVMMFLVLSQLRWDQNEDERRPQLLGETLNTLSIIVIGIWLWSGLHKLNMRYLAVGYPWMISPFTKLLPEPMAQLMLAAGIITPLLEAGGALLLLLSATRPLGVVLICLMHLAILGIFGPFGLGFNHSVWSWNIAQICLCLLLFWRRPQPGPRALLLGRSLLHYVIAVLFVVMPVGNYFGVWDDFLSHALYSWTTKEAEIELRSPEAVSEVPQEAQPAIHTSNGRTFIHVLEWSYLVFESPPYHAHRVFKQVYSKLCTAMPHAAATELQVFERPHWRSGRSQIVRYRCTQEGVVEPVVHDAANPRADLRVVRPGYHAMAAMAGSSRPG